MNIDLGFCFILTFLSSIDLIDSNLNQQKNNGLAVYRPDSHFHGIFYQKANKMKNDAYLNRNKFSSQQTTVRQRKLQTRFVNPRFHFRMNSLALSSKPNVNRNKISTNHLHLFTKMTQHQTKVHSSVDNSYRNRFKQLFFHKHEHVKTGLR